VEQACCLTLAFTGISGGAFWEEWYEGIAHLPAKWAEKDASLLINALLPVQQWDCTGVIRIQRFRVAIKT